MPNTELLQAISDIMDLKLQPIKDDIHNLNNEMIIVKDSIQTLDTRTRRIELTMENELRKNINVIAEGHSDLHRRLDEALKIEQEKEMLHLRVNCLESDVLKVKKSIGIA